MNNWNKNFLVLSVCTLITSLMWAGTTIYRTITKSTIDPLTEAQMQPLQTSLNQQAIDSLKNKVVFTEEELDFNSQIVEQSEVATISSEILPE